MRLAVLLAVSVTASGCLAHTARERRQKGGVVLATGAAMVAGGVLLCQYGHRQENDRDGWLAACATWESNRDAEHDPSRRAALDAARPAHCAPPR